MDQSACHGGVVHRCKQCGPLPLLFLGFILLSPTTGHSRSSVLAQRDWKTLDAYPSPQLYRGPVQLPDFSRRDRPYARLRTRIRDGMRSGPNFAGHMALIEIGCGTGCTVVYAGDVRTGRVFEFPRGGGKNLSLTLHHNVGSRALVAYWIHEERCFREAFLWRGNQFGFLEKSDVGNAEVCWKLQIT